MPIPIISNFAQRIYDKMKPAVPTDVANGYPFMTYVGGIGEMVSEIDNIARQDANGNPPWSAILDPTRCPVAALPWLAQFAGVELGAGLTEAQQRSLISQAVGWKRGTRGAITAAIQQYLTGTKSVVFTERVTDAYTFTVSTLIAESPADQTISVWGSPTNEEPNPKLANNSTGWTVLADGFSGALAGDATRVAMPDAASEFGWRSHLQKDNNGTSRTMFAAAHDLTSRLTAAPGEIISFSADVYVPDLPSQGLQLVVVFYNAGGASFATISSALTSPAVGVRTRLSVVGVAPANTVTMVWQVRALSNVANDTHDIYTTKVLVGRNSSILEYFDGDMPFRRWQGTANASKSESANQGFSPTIRNLLANIKPAGLVVTDVTVQAQTYQTVLNGNPTYGDIFSRYATYDALLRNP